MNSNNIKKFIIAMLIAFSIIIISSFFVKDNIEELREILLGNLIISIFAYLILAILDVIFLPIILPFIPLASEVYGWPLATIILLSGWMIGSSVAFYLGRFSKPLVCKYISCKRLEKIENTVPKENMFLAIIFMRVTLLLDVTSYGLGMFTKVDFKKYTNATFIGLVPTAIYLSYLGSLPILFQVIGAILAIVIITFAIIGYKKKMRKIIV